MEDNRYKQGLEEAYRFLLDFEAERPERMVRLLRSKVRKQEEVMVVEMTLAVFTVAMTAAMKANAGGRTVRVDLSRNYFGLKYGVEKGRPTIYFPDEVGIVVRVLLKLGFEVGIERSQGSNSGLGMEWRYHPSVALQVEARQAIGLEAKLAFEEISGKKLSPSQVPQVKPGEALRRIRW